MVAVLKPFTAFVNAPLDGGVRQPNYEKLNAEIAAVVAEGTIVTALIEPKSRAYSIANCGIEFAGALSGAEDTALDAIIAAHLGDEVERGTDTHTFDFPGNPQETDDETVIGAGGLQKYMVGDFGRNTVTGEFFMADDLSVGAAVWRPQNQGVTGGAGVATTRGQTDTDAFQLGSSYAPITYDIIENSANFADFFSYSSPSWTCLKACRITVYGQADYTVHSGSTRGGLRLDVRKNGSSQQYFDDSRYSSTSIDGQTSFIWNMEMAVNDTVRIECRSYVGSVNVWSFANIITLTVIEDLS